MPSKNKTNEIIEAYDPGPHADPIEESKKEPNKTTNLVEVKLSKLPEGVEYNVLKDKYRAVLNKRKSIWFDTAAQASQVYKIAQTNKTFWALAFLETNK